MILFLQNLQIQSTFLNVTILRPIELKLIKSASLLLLLNVTFLT